MRTTKPISTISYNTTEFLALKLDELLSARVISFWAFIKHHPEDDETGQHKEHHHVYVVPSKLIQTDDIKSEFQEFDPSNPSKPLSTILWHTTKVFGDWYLYGLHDRRYLASKRESRQYHYCHDDFYTSDPDELLYLSRSIDMLSLTPYAEMIEAQEQGLTWEQYFRRGQIPMAQLWAFEKAWYLLVHGETDRGGRDGHE